MVLPADNYIVPGAGATVTGSFVPGTNGTWYSVAKIITFTITNPTTDDPSNHEAVLQLTTLGVRTAQISTAGVWSFPIPGIPFNCSFNTKTQVITCSAGGFTYNARTITSAVFTGTSNVLTQQLVGSMVITISGQANTVTYHVVDP